MSWRRGGGGKRGPQAADPLPLPALHTIRAASGVSASVCPRPMEPRRAMDARRTAAAPAAVLVGGGATEPSARALLLPPAPSSPSRGESRRSCSAPGPAAGVLGGGGKPPALPRGEEEPSLPLPLPPPSLPLRPKLLRRRRAATIASDSGPGASTPSACRSRDGRQAGKNIQKKGQPSSPPTLQPHASFPSPFLLPPAARRAGPSASAPS